MTITALTIAVAVLAALVIALGIMLFMLRREVHDMRFDAATAQAVADALRDGRDEEAIRELLGYLESAHGRLEALSRHARALDEALQQSNERSRIHLQRVGVNRFDASDDVSGKLSCALCVLDAHNDGFLITTLYDLNRSRTFVRAVRDGRTDRELLPEEADALQAAIAAAPVRPARSTAVSQPPAPAAAPGASERPDDA